MIAQAPQVQAFPTQTYISSGCQMPSCDTEAFTGDYLRWPTFRDLFTAIYINNPIFRLAWTNLTERFENKRLLVKSQLKILFNVQSVNQESGSAIRELQRTIQGCLTALEISGIHTDNWDCLLVYMCSSKRPKLTLSL